MGEWALVVATLGLVYATCQLARHTKSLSGLTGELVRIEEKREDRVRIEKKYAEVERVLSLAQQIQGIAPQQFLGAIHDYCLEPHPGNPIIEWMGCIRGLSILRRYILNNDAGALEALDFLLPVTDDVLGRIIDRSVDQSVRVNLVRLQGRLLGSIVSWREELKKR